MKRKERSLSLCTHIFQRIGVVGESFLCAKLVWKAMHGTARSGIEPTCIYLEKELLKTWLCTIGNGEETN